MKQIFALILICSFYACNETNENRPVQKDEVALVNDDTDSQEENTERFIRNYIKDINGQDWKSRIPKYLQSGSDDFLEQHTAFRASFPNYEAMIRHLVVQNNRAIVWLELKANYAKTYNNEDQYIDEVINGIEAKNQPISWYEVWYFNVLDGKFGDEWDFLKDNYHILKQMQVDTTPQ